MTNVGSIAAQHRYLAAKNNTNTNTKTKTETLDIKTKIKTKTLVFKTKTKTFKIRSRDLDPSLENPMSASVSSTSYVYYISTTYMYM